MVDGAEDQFVVEPGAEADVDAAAMEVTGRFEQVFAGLVGFGGWDVGQAQAGGFGGEVFQGFKQFAIGADEGCLVGGEGGGVIETGCLAQPGGVIRRDYHDLAIHFFVGGHVEKAGAAAVEFLEGRRIEGDIDPL